MSLIPRYVIGGWFKASAQRQRGGEGEHWRVATDRCIAPGPLAPAGLTDGETLGAPPLKNPELPPGGLPFYYQDFLASGADFLSD